MGRQDRKGTALVSICCCVRVPSQVIRKLHHHQHPVLLVCFDRVDGELLASSGKDGSLRVTEHRQLSSHALLGHSDRITGCAFVPDSRYRSIILSLPSVRGVYRLLVTGSRDATLRLWDCTAMCCLSCITANAPVRCLSLTFDEGPSVLYGDTKGISIAHITHSSKHRHSV